jgi:UDP-GlcNAc3NAcA epimerase
MRNLSVMTVVGARPQFVKAAVVSRAIHESDGLSEVMVHTGQHFDEQMSAVFFRELGIPEPAYRLHIHGGGQSDMVGRMLIAIEPIMLKEKPDWIVVYGDTNSTLAGGLAAAKLNLPLAHVEAGLRSYNRRMPEEINRLVVDHLASLHFCPTQTAVDNLAREGIRSGVHQVGDVMYDATLFATSQAKIYSSIRAKLELQSTKYAIATVHRAENTDDSSKLRTIVDFLIKRSREMPVIFPVHPRTRSAIDRMGISVSGLRLIEPLGYVDMIGLLSSASAVYTDSGGLQKEAYFHRVPCVTLRSETEWVETVECGWNRLWSERSYAPRREIAEYGDGQAGRKIVQLLQANG